MRVAIYFTTAADHPLTVLAADWLGRDAFTGERLARTGDWPLPTADLDAITVDPRRYGFHATMKAPFRLSEGRTLDEIDAALAAFCAERRPVSLGKLRVTAIGEFLALTLDAQPAELAALAASVVQDFDPFRAPLKVAELARRMSASLNTAQERHLRQWGYPYVLDQFRFHMSLTGPLSDDRLATVMQLLQERFTDVLAEPIGLDSLAIFVEPEPGADFTAHALHRFGP